MKKLLYPLIILCFIACEDDTFSGITEPPDEIRYMDDTLKTYYFFTVGSYWIYQRTDTNVAIFDTATVIRSVREITYDNQSAYQIEEVIVNIVHSYYKNIHNSMIENQIVNIRNSYDGVNRLNMSGGGLNKLLIGYSAFLSSPIDSVSIFNTSLGTGKGVYLRRDYDSIIQNAIIPNILELNLSSGPSFNESIHIAPHFGIIKFENSFDSTQWVLKEFNINPAY